MEICAFSEKGYRHVISIDFKFAEKFPPEIVEAIRDDLRELYPRLLTSLNKTLGELPAKTKIVIVNGGIKLIAKRRYLGAEISYPEALEPKNSSGIIDPA